MYVKIPQKNCGLGYLDVHSPWGSPLHSQAVHHQLAHLSSKDTKHETFKNKETAASTVAFRLVLSRRRAGTSVELRTMASSPFATVRRKDLWGCLRDLMAAMPQQMDGMQN